MAMRFFVYVNVCFCVGAHAHHAQLQVRYGPYLLPWKIRVSPVPMPCLWIVLRLQ